MSVELNQHSSVEQTTTEFTKLELNTQSSQSLVHQASNENKSGQHPLHTFDLTKMSKFYETCVTKLAEHQPAFKPTEWTKATPMPGHLSAEEQRKWCNPLILSEKQRVIDSFVRLCKDLGEPMILMPSLDLSDLQNFDLFLDALKQDGVNALRKYKQYLSSKDMRKDEIDLVCVHARYGIILVEVRDTDYMDYKRRSRAKMPINQARSVFKSLGKLIAESKGLQSNESSVPIMEFIALPNVRERPIKEGQKASLNYLIRNDLESSVEFAKWWSKNVVEPKLEQEKLMAEQNKLNKFDWTCLNSLVSLVSCVRSNSILPVVYPESESAAAHATSAHTADNEKKDESLQFQPALNIYAEFFRPKHEEARAVSKCVVLSQDSDRIRKTICLQALWLLLNDSQKKISVVCSELNKPFYEEFFARQRKIYSMSSLNNLRFYTDLKSCGDVNETHTLKIDGEVWMFDASIVDGKLNDVFERCQNLKSYWVFSDKHDQIEQFKTKLEQLNAKLVHLDQDYEQKHHHHQQQQQHHEQHRAVSSWWSESCIKLPLRLSCDLLIIGDMITQTQLKDMNYFLKTKSVSSLAHLYTNQQQQQQQHHHQQKYPYHQLSQNASRKIRSIKFIRGGTIDNIRDSLKMHDSIQAQVVLIHVGDEDVFKTRNSVATIERIKELATLVKEYCPTSFTALSTLMKRMSRTENAVTNEVNKGLIQFCKETKDTLNLYYMLNNHIEPEKHTQGGRLLTSRGLKHYVDNILFTVDYFHIKNNKQH